LEKGWQATLAKRFPVDDSVLFDRWQTVLPGSTARPLEERVAIADAYSAMMLRSPDTGSSVPPLAVPLADLYTRWRVRLDRVPALIQEGLKGAELEAKYRPDPTMLSEDMRRRMMDPVAMTHWRAFLVLADLYLYQRKLAQAREVIQVGISNVELRPIFWGDQGKRDAEFRRQSWLPRQARLADLEGDAPAALAFYRQYTQSVGRQGLINARNSVQELQDTITDAKRAYLASGGREDSWLDWATSTPAPALSAAAPATLDYPAALPDFQAKDLDGRAWSLADLKGKATLIDVWATWCGACRAEHATLQELYDRIKGRKDIRILTFSMDETSYLAAAYMKEWKYAFPVIASKDLGEKLFPVLGFPRHWIVDGQGRRSSPLPWSVSDFERVIAELERAAGAK
jgi:thiol-disulfide isomerase/thioredoxin